MKSILFILCLGLGSFAVWQNSVHRSEINAANSRVEKLADELKLVRFGQGDTTRYPNIEEISNRVALTREVDRTLDEPSSTTTANNTVSNTRRLKELEKIYNDRRGKLDDSKTLFTRKLSTANSRYQTLQNTPPTFDEQGSRYGWRGNRLGATGVRTSDSDRNREWTKYNEEIIETTDQIALFEAELLKIDSELDRLTKSYQDAVAKAEAVVR